MNPTENPEIAEAIIPTTTETLVNTPEILPAADTATEAASVETSPEAPNPEKHSQPTAEPPFPVEISLNSLHESSLAELQKLAETVGYRINASRSKHQLTYDLLSWMADHRTPFWWMVFWRLVAIISA